jgi:HPt (histidine-containing phosphotransfer) domain-containing protein
MSDLSFLDDFIAEARENLEMAEELFLDFEAGRIKFTELYVKANRVFHSLKGASSMVGLNSLSQKMHQLETEFSAFKTDHSQFKSSLDYFLSALDYCKQILSGNGEGVDKSINDSSNEKFHLPVAILSHPKNSDAIKMCTPYKIQNFEELLDYSRKSVCLIDSEFFEKLKGSAVLLKLRHPIFLIDENTNQEVIFPCFGILSLDKKTSTQIKIEVGYLYKVWEMAGQLNKTFSLFMSYFAELEQCYKNQNKLDKIEPLRVEINQLASKRNQLLCQ